jgi:hypothetical protein
MRKPRSNMTAEEIAFWDNLVKALKEIYGEKVVVVTSEKKG